MAFPATDLPDPSTWFSNTLVTSALIKSNIIDPLNLLPRGFLGSNTSGSTVTLSTTSNFAGLATLTFTLPSQRRIKITTMARYQTNTATAGKMTVQSAYNTGSSVTIGSAVLLGQPFHVRGDTGGGTPSRSGNAVGDVLLAAGTYTAYAALARTGGDVSDTVSTFYTLVEDLGAS